MKSPILDKQRFVAARGSLNLTVPTEAALRRPLDLLGIDPLAGRAAEHELFRPNAKS
jgi:hypothetical protein